MKENKIIDFNRRTYLAVVLMLFLLMILSIVVTYVVQQGSFATYIDAAGNEVLDYTKYQKSQNQGGINVLKGLASPILVLFSPDGLGLIMLSIFIVVIAGAFQVMDNTNGMRVIVTTVIDKFKERKLFLVALTTLIFMLFGSFFGLFEEMLALLPIIVLLTISLGYDGFTGFLICIAGCAFGFASAITNPFTVIIASDLLGVSPMYNIWFRICVFIVMYLFLMGFILLHIKKITENPKNSPTYETDNIKRKSLELDIKGENDKLVLKTYSIFLIIALLVTIVVTSLESLRSYTVLFMIIVFFFGGVIAGYIASKDFKKTLNVFWKGAISAFPTILLILMASSIKYILEQGNVLATIANSISLFVGGKKPFIMAIMIYFIVVFVEFFISSSTAKAVFLMGMLSIVNINLSKELYVLLYLFGDGYTNILFPTSPVLLLGLSMIGMNYFSWVKRGKWFFLLNLVLVIGIIILAVLVY